MHGFDFSLPLFFTRVRGTRIVVTSQLVADVLHVLKVEHPNYLGCERLQTMSKDEMISAFYERPADWGDRQFTPCQPFAKGPRFMNMVMTFILHPLSHYNSITEPRARFLLSLLKHLLQIFLHISFFLSQMCIGIRLPLISSFSLRLSCRFYAIFMFLFPFPTIFLSCVPQTTLPLNVVRCSFNLGSWIQQLLPLVLLCLILLHPHLLLPLLRAM